MVIVKYYVFQGPHASSAGQDQCFEEKMNHSDRGHRRRVAQNSVILIIFMSNKSEMWFAFLTFEAYGSSTSYLLLTYLGFLYFYPKVLIYKKP